MANKKKNKIINAALILLLVISSFLSGLLIGEKFLSNKQIDKTTGSPTQNQSESNQLTAQQQELSKLVAEVVPDQGYKTKIVLGDSIQKLIQSGAIDKNKFIKIYEQRGGLPEELKTLLEKPSNIPLTINKENSAYLINLLWPLGIANKSLTLTESDAAKPENINDLASTGGWSLGKNENGAVYYNKFEIVKLTPEQDALVKKVAENIFRPCCGNSTVFPDCNHGAAMLGMLELGAAQGLTENELYQEALKFNIFWFPDNYTKIAIALKYTENSDFKNINPKILLSQKYSSGSGFNQNVMEPLSQIPGLLPQKSGGDSCST